MFSTPLVEMKPLDFLPQPMELTFPDGLLETALLEAALDAPSVPVRQTKTAYPTPVPARIRR
ncbi:hypothetical protein IQ265_17280 [Nodosilinea sp. LEGE 06152]|uniref:hypothetical protein n=1 Tax=Nodosilinea sp. LEGE 06152 TaxID=2777966 RepID=UPI001882E3E3|nr:hypothetical protein [Nodosilinea sp. LEGE 06152]MBE9158570.1 hypothetical protein [Nodosilinea sp. LEGE 06152]